MNFLSHQIYDLIRKTGIALLPFVDILPCTKHELPLSVWSDIYFVGFIQNFIDSLLAYDLRMFNVQDDNKITLVKEVFTLLSNNVIAESTAKKFGIPIYDNYKLSPEYSLSNEHAMLVHALLSGPNDLALAHPIVKEATPRARDAYEEQLSLYEVAKRQKNNTMREPKYIVSLCTAVLRLTFVYNIRRNHYSKSHS